jgi:hypothetical protein
MDASTGTTRRSEIMRAWAIMDLSRNFIIITTIRHTRKEAIATIFNPDFTVSWAKWSKNAMLRDVKINIEVEG